MINYVFFALGLITILISIFLLNKEITTKYHDNYNEDFEISNYTKSLESLEELIDNLNICFTDTISEIDKNYKSLIIKFKEMDSRISAIEKKNILLNETENIEQNNDSLNQPQDPRSKKIIAMKKNGMPLSQIAKQLNMGIGEIQLILNIYNKN